jgi:predicted RNase H-like HicB family nuclease
MCDVLLVKELTIIFETKRQKGFNMKSYRMSVVVEKDKDGYFVFCPELQGCYTQGDTYEEAIENIEDAIRLHIADRLKSGEEIPLTDSISLTSLEVAV